MRRRILFLLVIMSALAVRAYEKIPLRLDYLVDKGRPFLIHVCKCLP